MREKFTITPADEKYMASIGKSLHRSPKLVSKAQSRTTALKNKLAGGTVGKSHFSNKKYNHD